MRARRSVARQSGAFCYTPTSTHTHCGEGDGGDDGEGDGDGDGDGNGDGDDDLRRKPASKRRAKALVFVNDADAVKAWSETRLMWAEDHWPLKFAMLDAYKGCS